MSRRLQITQRTSQSSGSEDWSHGLQLKACAGWGAQGLRVHMKGFNCCKILLFLNPKAIHKP